VLAVVELPRCAELGPRGGRLLGVDVFYVTVGRDHRVSFALSAMLALIRLAHLRRVESAVCLLDASLAGLSRNGSTWEGSIGARHASRNWDNTSYGTGSYYHELRPSSS